MTSQPSINRVGMEKPWNIGEFYGQSYFCNPRGQIIKQASRDKDEVVVADLADRLETRKAVERAKGVLMKARGLDEDAAYHAMRKLAMERGQTMAKVARDVIDMARVLL